MPFLSTTSFVIKPLLSRFQVPNNHLGCTHLLITDDGTWMVECMEMKGNIIIQMSFYNQMSKNYLNHIFILSAGTKIYE
jgi:hypothetical protein